MYTSYSDYLIFKNELEDDEIICTGYCSYCDYKFECPFEDLDSEFVSYEYRT